MSYFQVHIGVKGYVRDKSTGKGLNNATVEVVGIAKNVKCSQFGDYWRILSPGTYMLHFSAAGYVRIVYDKISLYQFH